MQLFYVCIPITQYKYIWTVLGRDRFVNKRKTVGRRQHKRKTKGKNKNKNETLRTVVNFSIRKQKQNKKKRRN